MVGAVWFEQRRYAPWLADRRGGAARNRGSVQLRVLLLAALRHQGTGRFQRDAFKFHAFQRYGPQRTQRALTRRFSENNARLQRSFISSVVSIRVV